MKPKNYNKNWHKLFVYSEESPSGLVWVVPKIYKGKPNYDRIGNPVGYCVPSGNGRKYWVVGLGDGISGRKTYLIHRIIWVMKNKKVSIKNDIDHIDGNGLNNKIDNLRECSKSINMKNKNMNKNNKTGHIGVSFTKTNTSFGYVACFKDINSKLHRKFFSEKKYGKKEAMKLAVAWRKSKLEELNGAGYTSKNQ